jgi:hypothetical protein
MYIERECPYAGNCFSLRSWIRGCIRGYPPQDTLPQKIRPSKFETITKYVVATRLLIVGNEGA